VARGAEPHLGLYGEKSFATFPDEFLYRDIEAFIWGTFLLPWNWAWIFNPPVGTNDRMTEVYDRLMFHGATFADLFRRGRPQVSINATDIGFGTPFGFLPQTFDVICSDLASLRIAGAVAASNGFPVLFGPVTLKNYRGADCPLPLPVSSRAAEVAQDDLRTRALVENLSRYADAERTPWVHLRVSLSDYPDPKTRERLVATRTGLTLPPAEVDALVAAGATMIARDAGTIAAFLDNGAPLAVAARRR
jgi:NTE family protein